MRIPLIGLLLVAACGGGYGSDGSADALPASAEELAMESSVHDLVNAERMANSVAPLVHDDVLRLVARAHSQDMVARDFFDHVNPDGYDPFDRMRGASVVFLTAGENIAWNHGFSDPDVVVVDAWMNSSGHRANILNGNFTHGGLGVARRGDGAWFFTQVFALPAGSIIGLSWVEHVAPEPATSSWSLDG
ncbi:MAG: CAP domain-containing protein [Planctomycetota bacterium]|jgi:uncharacterized protein YkwD